MDTFRPDSLAAALDALNEAFLEGRPPGEAHRRELAAWLVTKQTRTGKQQGAFVPSPAERRAGLALFTGEPLKTKLGARNVLTAEAARALLLCGAPLPEAPPAMESAEHWLLQQCFARMCRVGECAHSAVALMRYLAAAGRPDTQDRLAAHIWILSSHRQGQGRWKRFPFYYTLLALTEAELTSAAEELRYAAPACRQALCRLAGDDGHIRRRRLIVERALQRC